MLWCYLWCLYKQAVEETVELTVIWDAGTLMVVVVMIVLKYAWRQWSASKVSLSNHNCSRPLSTIINYQTLWALHERHSLHNRTEICSRVWYYKYFCFNCKSTFYCIFINCMWNEITHYLFVTFMPNCETLMERWNGLMGWQHERRLK